MQRYSVKYGTVRSAMHETIHPYGLWIFGFAIHFALMLYGPLCVPVQAGEKPPRETPVNVQSLLCLHPRTPCQSHCCSWRRVQSAACTRKRKKENKEAWPALGGVGSSGGLAIGSTRTFLNRPARRLPMVGGPSSVGWSLVWMAGLTESNSGVMFRKLD